ncbi:MAG: DUF3078 domain-containing protein [bacterium]
MRQLLFITFNLILINLSFSKIDPWRLAMDANLTANQGAYSKSWEQGTGGGFAWAFNLNSSAEKQLSGKFLTKNVLKMAFGQTQNQNPQTKNWSIPVKSTDLFDLESTLKFTLGKIIDPFAGVHLISQFMDMSEPGWDKIFNPVDLTESLGGGTVFTKKEKRELATRLGLGLRQHVFRDYLDPETSVRENYKISNDGGLELVAQFKGPVWGERLSLDSKLNIFKALLFSEADNLKGKTSENYWKSPDISLESVFTANISKYIMVNLYLQFLYDKEIELKGRLKETLALGITYKFI